MACVSRSLEPNIFEIKLFTPLKLWCKILLVEKPWSKLDIISLLWASLF
jgi:hypothetical protein